MMVFLTHTFSVREMSEIDKTLNEWAQAHEEWEIVSLSYAGFHSYEGWHTYIILARHP